MPTGTQRIGDLEIPQDHEFQRRWWRIQRRAWVVMAGLVVLGLMHQADLEARLIQARADERSAREAEESARARGVVAERRASS